MALRDPLTELIAGKERNAFMFSATDRPMRHGNFYRRRFRPAVEDLVKRGDWPEELSGLRFHDLRHTCASLLIHEGTANMKAISEHVGHSSINITLDLYGHLYPEAREAVGKALDTIYREATKPASGEVVGLR